MRSCHSSREARQRRPRTCASSDERLALDRRHVEWTPLDREPTRDEPRPDARETPTASASPSPSTASAVEPTTPGGGDDAEREGAGAAPSAHTGTGVPASASATTSSAVDARRPRLRGQDQPMREHGDGERLDVVGQDEVAALDECARLREPQQRDPRARARRPSARRVLARVWRRSATT